MLYSLDSSILLRPTHYPLCSTAYNGWSLCSLLIHPSLGARTLYIILRQNDHHLVTTHRAGGYHVHDAQQVCCGGMAGREGAGGGVWLNSPERHACSSATIATRCLAASAAHGTAPLRHCAHFRVKSHYCLFFQFSG